MPLTACLSDQLNQLKHAECEAQAIQCDVSDEKQQQEVFDRHMQQFGVLDIAILNAGIGEKGEVAPDCAVVGMSNVVNSFVASELQGCPLCHMCSTCCLMAEWPVSHS